MSYYRKYRPQVIEEIDNENVRAQLSALMNKERSELPHAYFFSGPKGTGKTTSARVIAKLFNCQKPTKQGPCGTCEQCVSISEGKSLDVVEMDAASNRGIDEIRELRERIGLSPVSASYTIYIIDEVHMLTTEAFNALLKTLEEPPKHAVFVLATTDAHKVPATIKSRCMEFRFQRASQGELMHALERITKEEKIDISKDGLIFIAGMADGSFRDAVKLLEQASLSGGKLTEESLQKMFVTPTYFKMEDFAASLGKRDVKSALGYVENVVREGIDPRTFITFVMQYLHGELVSKALGKPGTSVFTVDELKRLISAFGRAYEEVKYSPIPELPLTVAIVECCGEPTETPPPADKPAAPQQAARKAETPKEPEPVKKTDRPAAVPAQEAPGTESPPAPVSLGLISQEKLLEHWADFIAATKPYNHSVAGVLRSSRPKSVADGIVTIEAFYKFHQEKLADSRTKQVLADVLKKLFGEKVKVDVVLGKK